MNSMSLRHTILFFLTAAVVVPASAQTMAAGSDIVSRTLLSSYGTRAVEQRVYDNGLGDVVQEIQSRIGVDGSWTSQATKGRALNDHILD